LDIAPYIRTQTVYTYHTLLDQKTYPDCGVQSITVTSYDITNCIVRGDSEGAIAITISGATGSTNNVTYKANGITYATNASLTGYTYTGLTAGVYNVLVEQQSLIGIKNDLVVLDGEFRTGPFTTTYQTELVAVESPVVVNVGTAINDPNPLNSITSFTVSDDLADGYHIEFNLTSPRIYSTTLYSKAFPNKPNYFLSSILNNALGVPSGVNSHIEIATSLAEAMQNDVMLSNLFFIISSICFFKNLYSFINYSPNIINVGSDLH